MRRVLAGLVLVVCMIVAFPSEASAWGGNRATWHWKSAPISSFGYSYGGISIAIPTGCFLSIAMKYNEKTAGVQKLNAGTDCIGVLAAHPWWFCNSKMSFTFYDTQGRKYYKWTSRVNTRCRTSLLVTVPQSVAGRYGKMCVRLYVDGDMRKKSCKSIHS